MTLIRRKRNQPTEKILTRSKKIKDNVYALYPSDHLDPPHLDSPNLR